MYATIRLLIAITVLTAATPVYAQGLEAGNWQTMTPSGGIGPEQDSLLPPEVVPLDPATANSLSASQAQSRQSSMAGQTNNVPGLVNQDATSPTDMRRQALSQLYGNQSTLPPNAMNQIWRAGQTPVQQAPQQPLPGQPSASLPPVGGNFGQAPSQIGGPNYQMANNAQQTTHEGYIAQSQTLTGSSTNEPVQQNTRRGGFSNMLNYGAAGALGLGSSLMMHNPWLGAGMFGMTMTGFGVRNNSRF